LHPPVKRNPDYTFISTQTREKLPHIVINLNDKNLLTLLDTGSDYSVITQDSLPKKGKFRIEKETHKVMFADKSTSCAEQVAYLPFKLGNFNCTQKFLVLKSSTFPVILGVDWMKDNKVNLFLDQGLWSWRSSEIKYPFGKFPTQHIVPPAEKDISSVFQNTNLTPVQQEEVKNILNSFESVFQEHPGRTYEAEHEIKLIKDEKFYFQPYKTSPPKLEEARKIINEMLKFGLIKECTDASYVSPAFLHSPPGKKSRYLVDYRHLNSLTVPNKFPMPLVDSVLFNGKEPVRYASKVDMRSAFMQLPIKENCQKYASFSTPFGNYTPITMTLGMCNAPATFQMLVNRLFKDLNVFPFMDDLLIISSTFEGHCKALKEVLQRISDAGMTCNIGKTEISPKSLNILGHMLKDGKLYPQEAKTKAIREYPRPDSVRKVRSLLGITNWNRKYINKYSEIALPLYNLLKSKERFVWSKDCENAFQTLKAALINPPILTPVDPNLPFEIFTDSSGYACAAVLLLRKPDNTRNTIYFASRVFQKDETPYPTTMKEALGITFALKQFRPLIEGAHCTLYTDHSALTYLKTCKDPNQKLLRMALFIHSFNIDIKHVKGAYNNVADALSRAFTKDEIVEQIPFPTFNALRFLPSIKSITNAELAKHQKGDTEIVTIRNNVLNNLNNANTKYIIIEDIVFLYKKDDTFDHPYKAVVPRSLVSKVFHNAHESELSAHLGYKKTLAKIRRNFVWRHMAKEIESLTKSCQQCQYFKSKIGQHGKFISMVPKYPIHTIYIDIVSLIPSGTQRYNSILSLLCPFSKYVQFYPLTSPTTSNIIDKLLTFFTQFGFSAVVISDNGSNFCSKQFEEFCATYDIAHKKLPIYRPSGNLTERTHRTLKQSLAIFTSKDQKLWLKYVDFIAFAMRTAMHETTKLSPGQVLFGRQMRSPFTTRVISSEENIPITEYNKFLSQVNEMHDIVRKNISDSQEKQKLSTDHKFKDKIYNKGDYVLRKNFPVSSKIKNKTKKLEPKFLGPFQIHSKIGENSYKLIDDKGNISKYTVHVNDLKTYYPEAKLTHQVATPLKNIKNKIFQTRIFNNSNCSSRMNGIPCLNPSPFRNYHVVLETINRWSGRSRRSTP